MTGLYKIGNFPFSLCYPEEVSLPEAFLRFACPECTPEYHYTIQVVSELPQISGVPAAVREDIVVFSENGLETRIIGSKRSGSFHALYRETAPDAAEIQLMDKALSMTYIDPIFVSLLALERRMQQRQGLILHCAYIRHNGSAILFSAPSGTGKSTQAGLWEQYRGAETINGDRALLQKIDGTWQAEGWPICGSSEICRNITTPIRAIVMLDQAKEDRCRRPRPMEAFSRLYSQITVNTWNREFVSGNMDLIGDLIANVPTYHLGCTISENAVRCLEAALEQQV